MAEAAAKATVERVGILKVQLPARFVTLSSISFPEATLSFHHFLIPFFLFFPFFFSIFRQKNKSGADVVALDLTSDKRTPLQLLSDDGMQVLNPWYIPYESEVVTMFDSMPEKKSIESLKVSRMFYFASATAIVFGVWPLFYFLF